MTSRRLPDFSSEAPPLFDLLRALFRIEVHSIPRKEGSESPSDRNPTGEKSSPKNSNAKTRPARCLHTGRQKLRVSPMGSIRNNSCPETFYSFEPDMGQKEPLRQPQPVSGSGKRSAVRLPNNGRWHIFSRSSLPDKQKPFFTPFPSCFLKKYEPGKQHSYFAF